MPNLKMDEARTLKTIVGTMSSILNSADFELGPDGLESESMDPSNVVLVRLELPPEAFREYDIEEPETFGLT